MTTIENYLDKKFADTKKSGTIISESDNGKSLVQSEVKLYDFDAITKKLFDPKLPSSVDGLNGCGKKLLLVEFKSGFRDEI